MGAIQQGSAAPRPRVSARPPLANGDAPRPLTGTAVGGGSKRRSNPPAGRFDLALVRLWLKGLLRN